MDAPAHDKAIKQAASEVELACKEAEALVPQFMEAVADFVTAWAKSLIERAITSKPEVTKSLGSQRLAQMKTQFQLLLDAIPTRTHTELDRVDIWPHRSELPKETESNYSIPYDLQKQHGDMLTDGIRELIGDTGALLVEYGFTSTSYRGEWGERTGKTPRYGYGIPDYGNPHAPALKKLNEQYNVALNKFVAAGKKLKEAERGKASAQAKSLWDQA